MPRFKVRLEEIVAYDVEVEAEDADLAEDAAEEAFVQGGKAQFIAIKDRLAMDVTLIEDSTVPA